MRLEKPDGERGRHNSADDGEHQGFPARHVDVFDTEPTTKVYASFSLLRPERSTLPSSRATVLQLQFTTLRAGEWLSVPLRITISTGRRTDVYPKGEVRDKAKYWMVRWKNYDLDASLAEDLFAM